MRWASHLLGAPLLLLIPFRLCLGATIQLSAAADNTIYDDPSASLSNGAGQFLNVGVTADGLVRRGLVRFDVAASIPPQSIITEAVLTLHLSQSQSGAEPVAIHRLLSAWGEGTSDALGGEGAGTAATADDATWVHRFFPDQLWATAGGDLVAMPRDTVVVGAPDFYHWGSNSLLVNDVQAWLEQPGSNFGWVVVAADEISNASGKRFDSRESPVLSNRPQLTVEYRTIPEPPSAGLAIGVVLMGGLCGKWRYRRYGL